MADEMLVSYSVKEVLERLERKIDGYRDELTEKLERHDERITSLEADRTSRDKRTESRRWFYPMVASTVVGLMAVLATVLVVIIP